MNNRNTFTFVTFCTFSVLGGGKSVFFKTKEGKSFFRVLFFHSGPVIGHSTSFDSSRCWSNDFRELLLADMRAGHKFYALSSVLHFVIKYFSFEAELEHEGSDCF